MTMDKYQKERFNLVMKMMIDCLKRHDPPCLCKPLRDKRFREMKEYLEGGISE